MNEVFISNIISVEEITKWKYGGRILISSATGTGKTRWVLDVLLPYCEKNNLKILLLENRKLLEAQIHQAFIGEDAFGFFTIQNENIDVRLYQSIEKEIVKKKYDSSKIFKGYDFIIFDECGYFISDSAFSRFTDLILNEAYIQHDDNIFLFISATPHALINGNLIRNNIPPYYIKPDYSYIKNLIFYVNPRKPIDIFKSIPPNEKGIFIGKAKDAYEYSKLFKNSSFICAKSNSLYKHSDEKALTSIIEKQIFNNQFLFTTRVMENGITLIDEALRNMILGDSIDPLLVVQMQGRKRITSIQDTMNLYVRNHFSRDLIKSLYTLQNYMDYLYDKAYLLPDDFLNKYKKHKLSNLFDNDMTVNQAKLHRLLYNYKTIENIIDLEYGYKEYICNLFSFPLSKSKKSNSIPKFNPVEIVTPYLDTELYKINRDQFELDFHSKYKTINKYRTFGIKTVNKIFKDFDLPLIVESKRNYSAGINRNKSYWFITKKCA